MTLLKWPQTGAAAVTGVLPGLRAAVTSRPAAAVLAAGLQLLVAAAAPADDLFLPAGPAAGRDRDSVAAASAVAASGWLGATLRQRHARIAPGLLDRAREAARQGDASGVIDLNLFDDTSFRVAALRTAPTSAGYSLSGELEGEPLGSVIVVVNGDAIAGEVRAPGATWTIGSVGGIVEIRQTDEGALPECAAPARPPQAPAGAGAVARDLPALAPVDPRASTGVTDLDILVVYTAAAREFAGGEAAMEVRIDLLVAAVNTYFQGSGVNLRVRLAHAEELDYVETDSSDDLPLLRGKNDGLMDEVHAMRDAVGADLVHLIERWGAYGPLGYCGLAYIMLDVSPSWEQYAFGATVLGCGSGVFAHEIGHNMGLHHDRWQTFRDFTLSDRPYPHAYGYVNQKAFAAGAPESRRWRTIMAYRTQCSDAGFDCPRIGRFSNPALALSGDPLGIWRNGLAPAAAGPADAASALNETLPTVAAFRAAGSAPEVVSLKRRQPAEERTSADSLSWRLAFSRDVKDVSSDDFELSGSGLGTTTLTVAAKSGSQRIHDITVTGGIGGFDGEVQLGFASGQDIKSLSDVALVTGWPAHAERSWTLDNTAPAPTITPSSAGGSPFVATVAFSEDVTGFGDAADVTATNATVTAPSRSDARTYTVQVTPTVAAATTITLSVPAAAASDLAGHGSVAASRSVAWDPSTASSLTVSGYSDGSVAENTQWTSATPATGGSPSGAVAWTKEGADADLFTINSSSGVLRLPPRDYEDPADADGDGGYEVTARATDAKGNSAVAGVEVTVTDAAESKSVSLGAQSEKILDGSGYRATHFLDCGATCLAEGGPVAPVIWTKTGFDRTLFSLDSSTGALSLGARDIAAPADADQDNAYLVTVIGTDGDGNTASANVKVEVIEGPPMWLEVSGVGDRTVAEGEPWSSPAPGASGASGTVTWTKEGPDAERFSVDSAGVLRFAARNFRNPADADANNVYEVWLRATDARGNSGAAPVRVTVAEVLPELSVASVSGSEGGGALTFGVSPSKAGASPVTVNYATSNGTARAGSDYVAASGTLTFPAGSTASRQVVVNVLDDTVDEEEEETFVLTLRNATNASLAGGGSTLAATGTIHDDDDPSVAVSFGASRYNVTEGRSAGVAVRLDRDPERHVEVFLEWTHLGGATPADYWGLPASVSFSSGQTRQTFEVGATDDEEDDDGESVALRFATPLPDRVAARGGTTIAIADNDGGPPTGGPPTGGPGGPGGPPPPPDDEEDDEDDEDDGDDGGPPPGGPPRAAMETDAECEAGLCRARTGEPVSFRDASAGSIRSRMWEFGDGGRSRSASPSHAWASPGFYEVALLVSDGSVDSTASLMFLVEAAEPAGACVADEWTRCLGDSRYAVTVDWRGAGGETGRGRVAPAGTNESGMFRFFDANNWEILIKVLDGCAANGHAWVFGASTTDLGYVIRVTDTATGAVKEYRNEPGTAAAAITDVKAFPQGCR